MNQRLRDKLIEILAEALAIGVGPLELANSACPEVVVARACAAMSDGRLPPGNFVRAIKDARRSLNGRPRGERCFCRICRRQAVVREMIKALAAAGLMDGVVTPKEAAQLACEAALPPSSAIKRAEFVDVQVVASIALYTFEQSLAMHRPRVN